MIYATADKCAGKMIGANAMDIQMYRFFIWRKSSLDAWPSFSLREINPFYSIQVESNLRTEEDSLFDLKIYISVDLTIL